jgi:flagellar basal-body rod modification protein FlgD
MSTLQATSVSGEKPVIGSAAEAPREAAPASTGELANQEVFLRLLVAQMQNQNPLSPADPIQFLSQLAQFSSLEQTIHIRQRLDAIHEAMLAPAPADPMGAGPEAASPQP